MHRSDDRAALMIRRHRGLSGDGHRADAGGARGVLDARGVRDRMRGRSATPAHIGPSSARVPRPLRAPRSSGSRRAARLLDELDPVHPARSTLEVKTRRLLVAHGITDFVREFPLEWHGRTYRFDFGFRAAAHDSRDQRTAVARRRGRLRARQREVERPGPPRLPHRLRDMGEGHAQSHRVRRRAHRDPDRPSSDRCKHRLMRTCLPDTTRRLGC